MATNYKILGQNKPSAQTSTTVYTCPASTEAVISTISACNVGESPAKIIISIIPSGQTEEKKHHYIFNTEISFPETLSNTIGITLSQGDFVNVYSTSGEVSFHVYGSEIS